MADLLEAPGRLVEGGRAHTGHFLDPVRDLNVADLVPAGTGWLPRCVRELRLKEWQHFAVVTKSHFLALAVANAKVMGVSWVYAFDRASKVLTEHVRKGLPSCAQVSRDLWNGTCCFPASGASSDAAPLQRGGSCLASGDTAPRQLDEGGVASGAAEWAAAGKGSKSSLASGAAAGAAAGKGCYRVAIRNDLGNTRHMVEFDASSPGSARCCGRIELSCGRDEEICPLVASLPLGGGRVLYTVKALYPVGGEIVVGDDRVVLDPERDFAMLDVHHAWYPYRTWWKWATFAGRDSTGAIIGANLTHNLIEDDATWNENAMWHGKRLSRFSAVRFEIPADIMQPWHIRTTDNRVHLEFTPEGLRRETIDLKLFVSWYQAPFGRFSGTLIDDGGITHQVKDAYGICEHHRVTW